MKQKSKEVKMIIVVAKWLHPLILAQLYLYINPYLTLTNEAEKLRDFESIVLQIICGKDNMNGVQFVH